MRRMQVVRPLAAAAGLAATALLAAFVPPAQAQDAAEPPLTLASVLEAVRAHNPTLSAARRREAVDRASVDVARELPNPEVRYEKQKETPRESIGVAQLVELPGKRSRRVAAARAAALTGRAEIAQLEADLAGQGRRAFYALAAAQRQAAAGRQLVELARRAHDAAAARFEAGDVSQLDVLQAEVELSQAENEATTQAGTRAAAAAELNVMIGREALAATVVKDEVDVAQAPDPQAMLHAADSGNLALALADRQVAEARARAAVARAERWPEPMVEAALTHGAEPEFDWGYRVSVGLALPLFTRHGAAVRVEEATLAQRQAERQAVLQRARGAVVAALARADAQRQRYLRFRDSILPKNREVEEMAEEAYRVGQTPLSALLQALRQARELRGQALDAASSYETALADLEEAVTLGGRP